jgi:hypothetical protein
MHGGVHDAATPTPVVGPQRLLHEACHGADGEATVPAPTRLWLPQSAGGMPGDLTDSHGRGLPWRSIGPGELGRIRVRSSAVRGRRSPVGGEAWEWGKLGTRTASTTSRSCTTPPATAPPPHASALDLPARHSSTTTTAAPAAFTAAVDSSFLSCSMPPFRRGPVRSWWRRWCCGGPEAASCPETEGNEANGHRIGALSPHLPIPCTPRRLVLLPASSAATSLARGERRRALMRLGCVLEHMAPRLAVTSAAFVGAGR